MAYPKIKYPSDPALPPAPTLSSVVGGAYRVTLTYQTPYGETMVGSESVLAIPINKLVVVTSPIHSGGGSYSIGYNVYATAGGAGTETKQNGTYLDIGDAWTEPLAGLVTGSLPPTSWGTTLTFRYPPRFKPSFADESIRHDNIASSGVMEVVYERTDDFLEFDVEWVAAEDQAAWQSFLAYALTGGAFDYYADANVNSFVTYTFENMDARLAWKSPGMDQITGIKMRRKVPWP
jgi:hypothetical protein